MVELTGKDFELFKKEAQYWIDAFGLKDWRIYYAFERIEDAYATCSYHWHGKIATLTLDKWPSETRTDEEIRRSAFHEVCELLLVEMRQFALDEVIPHEERKGLTDSAAHGVIRRLENSVFKMWYDIR